jgi:hypothetical protein
MMQLFIESDNRNIYLNKVSQIEKDITIRQKQINNLDVHKRSIMKNYDEFIGITNLANCHYKSTEYKLMEEKQAYMIMNLKAADLLKYKEENQDGVAYSLQRIEDELCELQIMIQNKRKLKQMTMETIAALEAEEAEIKAKLNVRESDDKTWDSLIQVIKIIRPEIIEYDIFYNSKEQHKEKLKTLYGKSMRAYYRNPENMPDDPSDDDSTDAQGANKNKKEKVIKEFLEDLDARCRMNITHHMSQDSEAFNEFREDNKPLFDVDQERSIPEAGEGEVFQVEADPFDDMKSFESEDVHDVIRKNKFHKNGENPLVSVMLSNYRNDINGIVKDIIGYYWSLENKMTGMRSIFTYLESEATIKKTLKKAKKKELKVSKNTARIAGHQEDYNCLSELMKYENFELDNMLTTKDNENEKIAEKCRNIQVLLFALFTALMNFSLKFMRWIKIIDDETQNEIVNREMVGKLNTFQQEFIVYISNKSSNKFYNYAISYMPESDKQ